MGIEEYALDCLGAALLDESMVIEAVSDGVVSISGYSRESLIGTPGLSLVHPDDSERAGEAMLELVRTQLPTVNGIYRMRLSDDAYEDYAIQALTCTDDGSVKTVLKFSAVSLVLRADEFARDAVDTLRLLGEGRQLNDCLERVHHLAERHIPGNHLAISTVQGGEVWTHRRASGRAFCWEQPSQVRPPNIERALANHLTGPWRAFSSMAEFEPTANGALITSVLTDGANELLGYVEATRESVAEPDEREWMVHGLVRQVLTAVLRRVRLDEQLRHAADHDPLTGLANRRRLFNDMAAADDIAGTSLLLIDLDRFSWINNNLGHDVGDQALVAVAARLRELCPTGSTITRFGGDEFVVWFPAPLSELGDLYQALRSAKIMPSSTGDRRSTLRSSIGAITIRPGETAAEAIKRADDAMYEAKSSGGDRIHIA